MPHSPSPWLLLAELDRTKRAAEADPPAAESKSSPTSAEQERAKRPGNIPKPKEPSRSHILPNYGGLERLLKPSAGADMDYKIKTPSGIVGARG